MKGVTDVTEETIQCWSCGTQMTLEELSSNDGDCPECEVEIALAEYLARALAENAELRAQPPSQGGEAVEVVAWRHWGDETRLLCDLGKQRAIPGTIADEFTVPLMEVAQHQRILAASAGSAEPVSREVVEHQQLSRFGYWDRIEKDVFDLGVLGHTPERFRALYTTPPSPDAELVALLRDERTYNGMAVLCQAGLVARCLCHHCRMKRIGAKLASLTP
jgi:hypothetical protein